MQNVRIIEIPAQKMVSSQPGMFGDGKLETFMLWMDRQKKGVWPNDFLTDEPGAGGAQLRWLHLFTPDMDVPEELEMYDFPGGLYAVATDKDQDTDYPALVQAVGSFLAENGFVIDNSRPQLGNVITPPAAQRVLGYGQMDYYFPIEPIEA